MTLLSSPASDGGDVRNQYPSQPHWAKTFPRVEDAFAGKYGWNPDRTTRVGEKQVRLPKI